MRNTLSLQSLPPKAARLCLRMAGFVEKELGIPLTGQSFLVGFSGGADSTALLVMLHALRRKYSLNLSAVHINHCLRQEADQEAEHCRELCAALGIPCTVRIVDVPALREEKGLGLEEAARTARYAAFVEELGATRHRWLALGHHLDDLAADILMRMTRGAGWPELSGMPAADPRRSLLRPLLNIPRRHLEAMLRDLDITWVEDLSNRDPAFLRNRIRMEFLPLFLRENPAFLEHAANLHLLGTLDKQLFAELMREPQDISADTPLFLKNDALVGLSKSLRLRVYKQRLSRLKAGQALFASLLALDDAWRRKKTGAVIQFSGGGRAVVHRNGIAWERWNSRR